jgi:A/G-specific adenine glycosylase
LAPAPGDWTQALMEFGATVCVPRNPDCLTCPLSGSCRARQAGRQMELPQKPLRKALPHYDVSAAVILRADRRILIARRPLKGMLGGLWEFPGGKRQEGESLQQCLQREILEELGAEISVGEELVCIRHSYSHFRISLYAFLCRLTNGQPRPLEAPELRWVWPHELPEFAFPVTDQKIVRVVMGLLS